MLTFRELSEKKSKIKINPKQADLTEKDKKTKVKLWTFTYVRLLNKPDENEVTFIRQNLALKCC